jgi:hypothetical protein
VPSYAYSCECGESFDRTMPISQCTRKVKCECGRVAKRDFAAEHGSTAHIPGNWPMQSDAMGVHPSQCKDAYEQSVRLGVPTRFDRKTGCAVLESAGHRKRFAEALGYYDRNAGYGDPKRR